MRPAARMPKLTRRSRILITIALAVILLLLVGPRLIDRYVDWLWFGELGFRSVFSTVLVTRFVVFLVVGLVVGGILFAGPGSPTAPGRCLSRGGARSGSAVSQRGDVGAAGVWNRRAGTDGPDRRDGRAVLLVSIQMFLHGGSFGVSDLQLDKDLGFYAFDRPFYRLVLGFFFVALFFPSWRFC